MTQSRIALVGLGAVSEVHITAYETLNDVEIVAGADPDEKRRDWASKNYRFQTFADHREMLDSIEADLICVLTPVALHRVTVNDALQRGFPVLCEKPFAVSMDDALEMQNTSSECGVQLFYGASYRHLPALLQVKRLIQEGAVGKPRLLCEDVIGGIGRHHHKALSDIHYPTGGPGGSGMGLVDHGIHFLDCLPWLINSPIISVYGRGDITGQEQRVEFALLNHESGAVSRLTNFDSTFTAALPSEGGFGLGGGWDVGGIYTPPGGWQTAPGEFFVYGDEGALRIRHYANSIFIFDKLGARQIPVNGEPAPAHFALQLKSALDDIRHDREPTIGADEGINALRTLLAIYQSQETGRCVEL